jgi:uncharacterized phage protein (TIGR02220 family)
MKNLDHAVSIINYLNEVTGSRFRTVKTNLRFIIARLEEGYSPDDLRAIIDHKAKQWLGTDSAMYLRPATLFNAKKCAQYDGQVGQPIIRGPETTQQTVAKINDQAERIAANLERRANG